MDDGRPTTEIAPPQTALGAILAAVEAHKGERVSLGDIVQGLGARAVPLAVLLLALPNCIPAPPGIGSILGLPLILLGVLLASGQPLWLPAFLARHTFRRTDVIAFLHRARQRFGRLESSLKPRFTWLASAHSERVLGLKLVFLAAVITLPLPLTNFVPAIGTALIAFGLVAKDGLFVALGAMVGMAGVAIAAVAVTGLVLPLLLLFG